MDGDVQRQNVQLNSIIHRAKLRSVGCYFITLYCILVIIVCAYEMKINESSRENPPCVCSSAVGRHRIQKVLVLVYLVQHILHAPRGALVPLPAHGDVHVYTRRRRRRR